MSTKDADDRRQRVLGAISTGITQTEDWTQAIQMDSARESCALDSRLKAVARLIPPGSRLVDIGSAGCRLERYLPEGCAYQPVDVAAVDPRTIVLDLNTDPLPALEADVAVAIGVLEYIHNIPQFLESLVSIFPRVIVTYYPFDLAPERDRVASGWYNALNQNELLYIARKAGWARIENSRQGALVILDMWRVPAP